MSLHQDIAPIDSFRVSEAQVNANGIHVWPFNPDFPIDVVRHSLSGTRPFRMNRHDYFELVYLLSGELVWQVQDSFLTQTEGDLFVMTSPIFHRITERSGARVEVLSLFFDRNLLTTGAGSDFEYLDYLFTQVANPQHLIAKDTLLPSEIDHWIREIANELPAAGHLAKLCVRTYVKTILVLLMDRVASGTTRSSVARHRQGSLERLKPLFEAMERNYASRISTEDAAAVVNMSLSTFRRTFMQLTGESFVQYLNAFRVAKAQKLLAESDLPISEVCLDVGFCDQSYFGMIFRRLTNMTPRHYRQSLLGQIAGEVPLAQEASAQPLSQPQACAPNEIVSSGFDVIAYRIPRTASVGLSPDRRH